MEVNERLLKIPKNITIKNDKFLVQKMISGVSKSKLTSDYNKAKFYKKIWDIEDEFAPYFDEYIRKTYQKEPVVKERIVKSKVVKVVNEPEKDQNSLTVADLVRVSS